MMKHAKIKNTTYINIMYRFGTFVVSCYQNNRFL